MSMAKHTRPDTNTETIIGDNGTRTERVLATVEVDITADAVRVAAHEALRAARAANRAHRGHPNPSATQIRDQVAALTEQVHLLTVLVLSLTGSPGELDDDEVLIP